MFQLSYEIPGKRHKHKYYRDLWTKMALNSGLVNNKFHT